MNDLQSHEPREEQFAMSVVRRVALLVGLIASVACVACSGKKEDSGNGLIARHGTGCPAPTRGPTIHASSFISTDEVWEADASPHIVRIDTKVKSGSTLTLQPCVEVLMAEEVGIDIAPGAALIAEGTSDNDITIRGEHAGSSWHSLVTHEGMVRFAYTTIDGGGKDGAVIRAFGDARAPRQPVLHIDHVTIQGSASLGIELSANAEFTPDSRSLTITRSVSFPLRLEACALTSVPAGDYRGNGQDEILVYQDGLWGAIAANTVIHNRGVPYRTDSLNGVTVRGPEGGPPAVLTIEPGVTIRFARKPANIAALTIDGITSDLPARGALIAVGTPLEPIVLTSGETAPLAGDWEGVWFTSVHDPRNQMAHVRVEYAGGGKGGGGPWDCPQPIQAGDPNTKGAVTILGNAPQSQFITDSSFTNSASYGIARGWSSGTPEPDFLPTNTFQAITWCNQSYPKNPNPNVAPTCPEKPPCPR